MLIKIYCAKNNYKKASRQIITVETVSVEMNKYVRPLWEVIKWYWRCNKVAFAGISTKLNLLVKSSVSLFLLLLLLK